MNPTAARCRRRSALVQGRRHLRGAHALVLRQQRRRHRRPRRASRAKLDYLRDLGVTALWLLPICPSPGRDDGYDISDYTDVHPERRHARRLPRASSTRRTGAACASSPSWCSTTPPTSTHGSSARAARRPARRSATSTSGATRRSATATRASSSRTSSRRTGRGIRVARPYYWHRFYSHQPDLNFENPAVQAGDARRRRLLVRPAASTGCGSTPCRTSTRRRAPTARTCPRRTRS